MATAQARTEDPAIRDDAPVVSSAEAEIDATIERVWEVLTAVERWPAWNPDVKSVSIASPLAAGSTFRWKAGPGTISSRVEHLDRPRLVAWSGTTMGIRAFHVWRLGERNEKTFVRTEESFQGFVARLLRRPLRKTLDTALADGVLHLKVEAERAAATPS